MLVSRLSESLSLVLWGSMGSSWLSQLGVLCKKSMKQSTSQKCHRNQRKARIIQAMVSEEENGAGAEAYLKGRVPLASQREAEKTESTAVAAIKRRQDHM